MDENKTNENMLEKAKTHKREILIGIGAVAGLAIGFVVGSNYVPKNTVKFAMTDKEWVDTYKRFFENTEYVGGAVVIKYATENQIKEYFAKAMENTSDEYLYGMILERYPKKKK